MSLSSRDTGFPQKHLEQKPPGHDSPPIIPLLFSSQLSPFLTLTPHLPFQLSSANGYPYRNSSFKRGQAAEQTQAGDAFKQNVTPHGNR